MALPDNLQAYYKMENNSNDALGLYNGTDTAVTYTSGKIGQGGSYTTGSSSHTDTSIPVNYSNTSTFTWSIWTKVPDATTGYFITSNVSPGAGNLFCSLIKELSVGFFGFQLGKSGTGSTNCTSSVGYTTNVWEHYVCTYDGANNMALYRNGVSVATATYINGSAGSGGSNLYLGYANNSTNYITGVIDEIGIWTRVLSLQEIQVLYKGGLGLQYPFGSSFNQGRRPALFKPGNSK